MRRTSRVVVGTFGVLLCISQTDCEKLWGGFSEPNPNYCDEAHLCLSGQACDIPNHICVDKLTDGGIVNDGGSTLSQDLKSADNALFAQAQIVDITVSGATGLIAGGVADFDNDGKKDLAVLCSASTASRLLILYGDGKGGFQQSSSINNGDGAANSLAIGEFSGDTLVDIALPGGSVSGLQIFTNPGARGAFVEQVNKGPSAGWGGITAGDLDADGLIDLVMIKENPPRINVRRQTSAGNFASNSYPMMADNSTAPGMSALVLSLGTGLKADVLTVVPMGVGLLRWVNSTGLTFSQMGAMGSNLPLGKGANTLTAADFNGDARPDIALANGESRDISILLGNGDGTFSPAPGGSKVVGDSNAMPRGIVAAHVVPDARNAVDLAVANPNLRNVQVFAGQGNGTFDPPVTVLNSSGGVSGLIDADLNQDGKADLVALDGSMPRLYVLLAK